MGVVLSYGPLQGEDPPRQADRVRVEAVTIKAVAAVDTRCTRDWCRKLAKPHTFFFLDVRFSILANISKQFCSECRRGHRCGISQ